MHEQRTPLRVGEQVPDFRIEIYDPVKKDFGEVSLGHLKNEKKWTILYFYPADFTFVCPTELADIAEKYEEIKNLRAEVISISTDTKYAHLAWHRDEKLLNKVTYPMGSDPTGALAKLFGVYDPDSGLALRGTFVIDPEGILVSSEVNFYNVGRNSEELLRKFYCNTYLAGHSDEACPAKWKIGDRTLKPSADLVGRVHEAVSEKLKK
jgi:peroxiredoxin (alkyl hydroperoxide reductase subunit C)